MTSAVDISFRYISIRHIHQRQLHYAVPVTHVILGLLHVAHMSLYDLIKAFEAGVSLFYGASAGSIKRAIDKLLAEGSVEVAHEEPGARGRRAYAITPLGKQRFETWMRGEIQGDFDTAALARLYFLGFMAPDEREPILARIRERAMIDLARLGSVEREIAAADVPENLRDVARYQRATLEYGLSAMRHTHDWFAALQPDEKR